MIDARKAKNPIARGIIIENSRPEYVLERARVRLDCKAPDKFDEIDVNGICRPTDLRFYLRFSPVRTRKGANYKIRMSKPFLLQCKMMPPKGQCRLKGYDDLMASDHPVLIWLRENTNISEDTFRMASENPYFWVPFCLNYGEYAKKTGTWAMTDYRINSPYVAPGDGGSDE